MTGTALSLTLAVTLQIFGGGAAASSADERTDLQAKLDAKLALPFVKNGGWRLDYEAARKEAAKEGKLLFVYFTRTFAP